MEDLKRAIHQLSDRVDRGFKGVDERFGKVDARFDKVDERANRADERADRADERADRADERMSSMDRRFDRIEQRLDKHDQHFVDIFALMNQHHDDMRRHFDVAVESFRADTRLLAEGILGNRERIDNLTGRVETLEQKAG